MSLFDWLFGKPKSRARRWGLVMDKVGFFRPWRIEADEISHVFYVNPPKGALGVGREQEL